MQKEVVEEVQATEYDNWDMEALKEEINTLKTQLEKAQLDRNYVQLERDTIQTFYDITRKEVVRSIPFHLWPIQHSIFLCSLTWTTVSWQKTVRWRTWKITIVLKFVFTSRKLNI